MSPPNVEDILSDADPVAEMPADIAARGRQISASLQPTAALEVESARAPEHASADHRWLFAAIAVVLLGIAILGFAIKWFLTFRPASVSKLPAPAVIAPLPAPPVTSLGPAAQEIPSVPAPLPSASVDSDRDGLSDTQETEHGTDVFLPDTDSDGLTDYDEVKVFGTDPKNPDSDGDGFRDGEEVASGYNPKGAGKLLDLEGALRKSNEVIK